MDGAKLKALKQIFPELRNFEGRFFMGFIAEFEKKVEDWAIWARLELGKSKCSNIYTEEVICLNCVNYLCDGFNGPCGKKPRFGQSWYEQTPDEEYLLEHPNTGEWYWCVKECPDFYEKEAKGQV